VEVFGKDAVGGKEGVRYSAGVDAGVNAVKDFYVC